MRVLPRCTFYSCCCSRLDSFASPQGKKLIVVEFDTKTDKYEEKKKEKKKKHETLAQVGNYFSFCFVSIKVRVARAFVYLNVYLRCHSLNAPFYRINIGFLSPID